jgi:hypothetical protein
MRTNGTEDLIMKMMIKSKTLNGVLFLFKFQSSHGVPLCIFVRDIFVKCIT